MSSMFPFPPLPSALPLRKHPLAAALALALLGAGGAWAQASAPAGRAGGAAVAATEPAEQEAPQSALTAELMYELLVGEISAAGGDARAAYELVLDAARKTDDPALYRRAVDLAAQARDGEGALRASLAWVQALPDSRDANRYLLQVLIGLNRLGDARAPLARELALASVAERPVAILSVPRYFARAGDRKTAALVVEQVLTPYTNDAETGVPAWVSIGRMRSAAGDTDGALEAAQRGQALEPQAEGPALLALALMGAKLPQAEGLVQTYLKGAKPLPEIRLDYARLLLDVQRYSEAATQLRQVVVERPRFAQAWLILGTLELQDNKLDPAEAALKHYVELATDNGDGQDGKDGDKADRGASDEVPARGLTQAYLYLAQIAEQRKDWVQANAWLDRINTPEEMLSAQIRRASLLARQGKLKEARELLKKQPTKDAAEARLKLLADVQLLRDAHQYKTAYDTMAQATVLQPEDVDLLYDQAMLAEKLGHLDDMERLLRHVIGLKPDYHHAYNALGYSLADRKLRLPEAKLLIQKALEFAPDDPFIRDSLGWVEFRIGNTAQAAEILQNAYNAKPDTEIAAHLGEVLWALGKRDQAQAVWREGSRMNADNETLRDTLKRLRVKP
jgi:tetratricopeptide (TPR) repeat protein